jgi:hypothetical protein
MKRLEKNKNKQTNNNNNNQEKKYIETSKYCNKVNPLWTWQRESNSRRLLRMVTLI